MILLVSKDSMMSVKSNPLVQHMVLTYRGQKIEIDNEDWPRVKQHNWYPAKDGIRTKIKGKNVLLGRFIMNPAPDEYVTFGSRGPHCYCKANLLVKKRGRGVYETPGGKFGARFRGRYLGTFSKIEDANAEIEAHRSANAGPDTKSGGSRPTG